MFVAADPGINAGGSDGPFFTGDVAQCGTPPCTQTIAMGGNHNWVTVVCNSALYGLVIAGDDSGVVRLYLSATSACDLGAGGVTTAPSVVSIIDSTFTFSGARSMGPVRLSATTAVFNSTLRIERGSVLTAVCNPPASALPIVAGFGFAAPEADEVAVHVDSSVVGCGALTVTQLPMT
jgi:hypothetical protein